MPTSKRPPFVSASLSLTVKGGEKRPGRVTSIQWRVNTAGNLAPAVAAARLAFYYVDMYLEAIGGADSDSLQLLDALLEEIQRTRFACLCAEVEGTHESAGAQDAEKAPDHDTH